jgi:hypothetical protein
MTPDELPADMEAVVARLEVSASDPAPWPDLRALLKAYQERGQVLKDLLDHVDKETCVHENTHRGGILWTICDDCGRKWADDEGGFVPHQDAPAVAKARTALNQKGDER